MSKHESAVCEKIRRRAKYGLEKYGVTMERDDLKLKDWLIHIQEEAMDLAVYAERAISDMSNHMITGYLRGHKIWFDGDQWLFDDTNEPTQSSYRERPCGHCGLHATPEGHDGCIGTLPGVDNACCGHGSESEAYIQYSSGEVVRGAEAIRRLISEEKR